MIFAIGSVLFAIGYVWYRGSPNYGDWRDTLQFFMQVIGARSEEHTSELQSH